MRQNGFIHLFLLVIVVLIGIGVLLYYSWQKGLIKTNRSLEVSPTPSVGIEEPEWLIFTDEKYRYSFKYPPDWKVEISKDEYTNWDQVVGIFTQYKGGEITGATIGTIHTWKQNLEDVIKELKMRETNIIEYEIDNNKIYKTENTTQNPITITKTLYFESGGHVHQMSFVIFDTPVKNQNIQDVDQILSTFKFIE